MGDDWDQVAERIRRAKAHRQQLLAGREYIVTEMTKLLFEDDPIGLNFGDNTDEYEAEAETIALRLPTASSPVDVSRIVHEEFVRWFDETTAGPETRYRQVAAQVWELWQRSAP